MSSVRAALPNRRLPIAGAIRVIEGKDSGVSMQRVPPTAQNAVPSWLSLRVGRRLPPATTAIRNPIRTGSPGGPLAGHRDLGERGTYDGVVQGGNNHPHSVRSS